MLSAVAPHAQGQGFFYGDLGHSPRRMAQLGAIGCNPLCKCRSRRAAYDPPVNLRRMRTTELDAVVSVWREANIARGAPHGPERTARIRAKLSASDALQFVALRPGIVGMALAEGWTVRRRRGRSRSVAAAHLNGVRASRRATHGCRPPLVLHVFEVAASLGYQRVGVWTAGENTPARKLYERAGMTLTGRSAPFLSGTQLQLFSPITRTDPKPLALWRGQLLVPRPCGSEVLGTNPRGAGAMVR
jgi:ribosomal protein S18 acetylase RimI-like enzyme